MIKPKYDDRANDGDKHAVEVEASDAGRSNGGEQEPSDHGADDAEHDVKQQTLT